MRKIFLILFFIFFQNLAPGWATPPSKIELSYDKDKKNLHVEVKHVTFENREHRIRKIEVSVNKAAMDAFYFGAQNNNSMQTLDIPLDLKVGDEIKVKAICSYAGFKEEALVIADPKEESTKETPKEKPNQK